MSYQETSYPISHADVNYLQNSGPSFEMDREKARANLDEQYPDYYMNDRLAAAIALVANSERSRRAGHYYRYRTLFGVADDERLFTGSDKVIESSLFDLDARIAQMDSAQVEMARAMGGKGISAELGHVDQLGDWKSGSRLDDEIRALPQSAELENAGFVFADTYGDKSRAKISYKIQLADELHADRADASQGIALKGVRTRAAADVLTESGASYDIVKLSTFVIHAAQLGRDYLSAIDEVLTLSDSEKTAHMAGPAADIIGQAIIEPFIVHPEFRSLSPGILAVSSMYFALHRVK